VALQKKEELQKEVDREECLRSTALMSEIAAPRSHAKSTCLSVNYPLQEIARNRNIRILIVSNALDQAQMFLREIKARITQDDNYKVYAGELMARYPEKWTDREIIVARDDLTLKDPTVSVVGMGGTILARRADIIICDDVLNQENTRTPEQRKKVKQWFYEVLLPVLEPGGRLIYIGTVWHPEDLLNELLKDPSFDFRKRYKAIISDSKRRDLWDTWVELLQSDAEDSKEKAEKFLKKHKKEMYEGVKVLWKERVPYYELYLLRKVNSIAFAKMYQNEVMSSEDQKFKEEWIERAKEMGANYRLVRAIPEGLDLRVITQGVDLAVSEKDSADDNVDLTLAKLPDNRFIILNIERGKFSPAGMRQLVKEQFLNFKPRQIKVENVAYQEAMRRDLADMNLPVKGYATGGEKFDEFIGIDTLAVLMENGRLILPYDKSDPRTINLIDQLVDEMRQWGSAGHTGDSLMALWFAYTAMRDIEGGSGYLEYIKTVEEKKNKDGLSLENFVSMYKKGKGRLL